MRRGFTLIELIIVIALIALAGGLVVINAQAILTGLGEEPVDRIFQKAVREGRYQAAFLKESAFMIYDEETGILSIKSEAGTELAKFPLVPEDDEDKPDVEFEQILPGRGLESSRDETVPVDFIVFRPDRSSTPFEVTIEHGPVTFTQRYDPFSAIVIHDSRNP